MIKRSAILVVILSAMAAGAWQFLKISPTLPPSNVADTPAQAEHVEGHDPATAHVISVAAGPKRENNAQPPLDRDTREKLHRWQEIHGMDKARSDAAFKLIYQNEAGAVALGEAGDMYMLAALGTYFRLRDPERGYNYSLEAAVQGSMMALTVLSFFEAPKLPVLQNNFGGTDDAESLKRQHQLHAMAFYELAAQITEGHFGTLNKNRLHERVDPTDEEIHMVCAQTRAIHREIERRRISGGVVPHTMAAPLKMTFNNISFSCSLDD